MNLGVVIPLLEKYGGAERYLIECLKLWQHRHDITLYSSAISETMLAQHGIGEKVKRTLLTPYFTGNHAMLLNAVLLPKIWKEEIARHDLYHTHLWPTHLIDLHPMVWFPHEPLRMLHDLRFEHDADHDGQSTSRTVHIYPKYNYDSVAEVSYEATLAAIEAADRSVRPERIVANSRYAAQYLHQVYDRDVEDIVYPGINPGTFPELPSDPNLFVTIGQLWAHKRFGLLIEAVALTDNAQLIIIGDGPERQRLQNTASRLGVGDRVFFLSGLSDFELKLVLARANAFVFAPIREPFGIVVLEAMAAGKPIIAVNQGGYVEACEPDHAFLLPPFPAAFAEAMSRLQADPDLGRRMGEAGRARAGNFSWPKSAAELEAILLREWQNARPAPPALEVEHKGPLVGVQYYLWYGNGYGAAHWNDSTKSGYVADKPLLGYYPSSTGQTIEYHLELMEGMGLDYVVLNLHLDANGINGLELRSLEHVFDIAARRSSPLKFAVQLAAYSDEPAALADAIAVIRKRFAPHPNYLTHKGRPTLFWFWSSAMDRNKAVFATLKQSAAGLCNLAQGLRLPASDEDRRTFGFFEGFGPFSPLELAQPKNWETIWTAGYAAAEKAGMAVRMATVSPGYDDHLLDGDERIGNPFRQVSREQGDTYRRGLDFVRALSPAPDLITIATFNEYHENTHIEPSRDNGMRYVEMTRAFITALREGRAST